MTTALSQAPSNLIGGEFRPIEGDELVSTNPAFPDEVVWEGAPRVSDVDDAVDAAREAFRSWSATPWEERVDLLRRWQAVTKKHADRIAGVICDEMGKTHAECKGEAGALGAKVDITLDEHALSRVKGYDVEVSDTRRGLCRFKPHGVMAVIAPFNFPAHLANGHFVPALLLGNTIVLKPSEKTPAVGQLLAELMQEAGAPPGVFNLVQGGPDVAKRLTAHPELGGILFTGSWNVGRRILEANLDRPSRIVALEMGGNSPAVVMPSADLKQAVVELARTAFATTGQRCTCTRRIILHEDIADAFLGAFGRVVSNLPIGPGRSETPVFMGPVVSEDAADAVIEFQADLARDGGTVLLEAARLDRPGHFVSPGIVEVDRFDVDRDREVFGPLVQITTVASLDEAIEQANATRYGLAASIFTADDPEWERYFRECRAGCINRNNGTAGASGKLPFGGLGISGNQRPAGSFSVDYCAHPVASMVETSTDVSIPAEMRFEDGWVVR